MAVFAWLTTTVAWAQCTNPTIDLPDALTPVNGNPATAYCATFVFDPDVTGLPDGVSMQLQHTWQGDLSIFVNACGNTLNIMQRPGETGNCAGGCPCGNSNDIGTPGSPAPITFLDGGGPDPEAGVPVGGGVFGLTADDGCGIGTPGITSFASLWAACPPGPITMQICIGDHAFSDEGIAADITPLFPNPVVCGCTDPTAINYNPNATIDDGSCIPPCATFSVSAENVEVCSGGSVGLSVTVVDGFAPDYTWTSTNGGGAFLSDPGLPNPVVTIPEGVTGSYTYVVVVNDPPCMGSATVTVTILNVPVPQIIGESVVCFGQTTQLAVTGGVFTDWAWSTGESTPTILAGPGDYEVTVTALNGCEAMASFTVIEADPPLADISGPDEICPGGTADLSATLGFAAYDWSSGDLGPNITVFASGVYTVTVTDFSGCTGTASFFLPPGPGPDAYIDGVTEFCEGGSTMLQGPPNMAIYSWSSGESTPTINANGSGVYTLTVLDDEGCPGEASVLITELPAPIPVINGPLEFCEGTETVLSLTQAFSTYQWSTGANDLLTTVTSPGIVSVTVTDFDGCEGEASVVVEELPNPEPVITGPDGVCENSFVILNASPGYQAYDWSTQDASQSIVADMPGLYQVTVTDGFGCVGSAVYDLPLFPTPQPQITGPAAICPGTTGLLNAGSGFAGYTWSIAGQSTQQVSVNTPGLYSVTVTNLQGCPGEDSFIVDQFPAPAPQIIGDLTLCPGESSVLQTSTSFVTYRWSNNTNQPTLTVNAAGTYSVTVTDGNGCTGVSSVVVNSVAAPTVMIQGDNDLCAGESSVLSTQMPFTSYLWSTGAATPTITVDTSATYSVTVTNANGCTGTSSYNVVFHPLPTVDIAGGLTFCPNGATILSVPAGFSTYAWSNGANTPTVQVNTQGNIGVTVTDANGCTATDQVFVQQQDQLTPVVTGEDSYCTGLSTVLTVQGSYTSYVWSTGSSQPATTVSTPGPVTVTVTDAFGCTGSTTTLVEALPLPQPQLLGTPEFCANESTTLVSSGSYVTYQWSTGSDQSSTVVSAPGTVGLTVTDGFGCVGSGSVQVIQNALPQPMISGTPDFCPGLTTNLNAPAGFEAYLWSTGSSATTIAVGAIDDYGLTVTDANGCEGSTSISVGEYAVNVPTVSGPLSFCPGTSTTLNAAPGFAAYQWSTGLQAAQLLVTAPANFGLTVTDANGCETSTSVTTSLFTVTPPVISGPEGFCSGLTATLTASPGYNVYSWSSSTGALNNTLTTGQGGIYSVTATDVNGCLSDVDYNLEEYDLPTPQIGGSLTYCIGTSTTLNAGAVYAAYQWSGGGQNQTNVVSIPGNVALTVTDNNGCLGSTAVNVIEATELSPVISGRLDYCIGGSTVLDAGSGYTIYQWSDGSTGQTLLVTAPGVYTLDVADATGCEGDAQVTVVENPLPTPQISGIPEFCVGESTEIQVTQAYESYTWNTGAFTPDLTVDLPGTYTVEVVDTNDCVNSTQIVVVERQLPVFTIDGTGYFCAGTTTSLTVSPSFTAYEWSNMANTAAITVGQAGTYGVTVTNEFGCESSAARPVQRIALPSADAGSPLILNCDITAVSLGGAGSSQGSIYSYEWTGPGITPANATQQNPVVDLEGDYTLLVTNEQYGCVSLPSTIEVDDRTNNPAVVLEVLDVLDCNTATVVIDGTQSANGPEIVYQWYNENQQTIPGAADNTLQAGNPSLFYLQVLDTVTGCANIAAIQVTENIEYPIAEAGQSFRLDCRETSVQLNGTGSQAGSSIVYNWYTPNGSILSGVATNQPTVSAPGWYYIEVMDVLNSCQNTDSVLITQNIMYPTAIAGPDQELNCLIEGLTVDGTGSSTGSIYTYQWLQNGQPVPSATSLNWYTTQAGDFTLVVTNQDNGCETRDLAVITRDEAEPVGLNVVADTPTCYGDTDGSLLVGGVQGGTPPYLYSLNGLPFNVNTLYDDLGAGTYRVSVQDAIGCEFTTQVVIEEANDLGVELGPDQNLDLGDLALVNAEVTIPAEELTDINWQTVATLECPTCLRHELQLLESTQFFIRIKDENGCVAEDLVTIFVRKDHNVYIPSAFSPNGDGTNDVFTIFSRIGAVAKVNSFLVFNRWGEAMFEVYDSPTNDPQYGWDGTHRGRMMNAGAYVWTAEVTFLDGVVSFYKGEVILMR